jgi:hypothetical protein
MGTQAGLPSSARRSSSAADEDASLPLPGEDDIWSTDDDWPGDFGAARLGFPGGPRVPPPQHSSRNRSACGAHEDAIGGGPDGLHEPIGVERSEDAGGTGSAQEMLEGRTERLGVVADHEGAVAAA